MYPYLTGSASWYLLTMVTEVFGIKGHLGDLELAPKLVRSQFDRHGAASITTLFAGRRLKISYHNSEQLDYGEYQIAAIEIDGQQSAYAQAGSGASLARQGIEDLSAHEAHHIAVTLGRENKDFTRSSAGASRLKIAFPAANHPPRSGKG